MEYKPLDVSKSEFRLLTVSPPTVGKAESGFFDPVRCSLEHFSLDDLKPGKELIRPSWTSTARRENGSRSKIQLFKPSFIASVSLLVILLFLYTLHKRRLSISHTLGLCHYISYLTIRSALGEDISVALQKAYQRQYFSRVWSVIFSVLISLTTLYACYLIFTSWRTAIIFPFTGFISELLLVNPFRRALQILNIDMNTVLLAEGELLIPDSRKFRFTWGDYIALSYVWGNPDPASMREIVVNGNIVKVRENLEAGLRRIRCTPEAYAGVRLWVDALCINQEDSHEKSREIKRMRKIYENASTVMVWLGEEAEESDVAVETLRYLGQRSTNIQIDPTSMRFVQGTTPLFQNIIKPIYRFLSRPYWERLWIIQELAMGDNSTVMLCGGLRLYWGEVYEGVRFLAATLGSQRQNFQKEIGEESFKDLSRLLWLICQLHDILPGTKDTTQEALDIVLRLGQNAATSEPRDKVYGLLGLLDPTISSRITPDYSLQVREVYVSFAKSVIEATGDLGIILTGSRIELSDDWPSWVPDWTLGFDRHHAGFNAQYRASGSCSARVRFSNMDEHLCCEGFKIGNVSSSKEIQHKKLAFWPHRSGHQFGDEEVLASSFKGDVKRLVYESGADFPRKEYNPLTDEAEIEEEIRPKTKPGLWQDKYKHNRREAFEYFMHGGMAFDLLTGRNLGRVFNQAMLVDETLESVFETLADKEEIAIIHGHSVSASESVEEGDIICILLGCQYPVILRPNKEGYSIVGECYIDDAMQGEAMAWLDSRDCQLEEFTLY